MKLIITGQASPDAWRMVVLQGMLTLAFGVFIIVYPQRTIVVLLHILGVFWVLEGGLLVIAAAFGHMYAIRWGALLGRGLLSILAGVVILSYPLVSAMITVARLASILGLLAIVFGLMEMITAMGIRETFSSKWSLMVGGILSGLVGVFLLIHPFLSAAVTISLVGFLTITVGLVRMVLALRLRVVKEHG
jgi:uncharacterized membrane protein HdeD (DUF308 family)